MSSTPHVTNVLFIGSKIFLDDECEPPLAVLHSANPVGRANMRGLLESVQRHDILPSTRLVEIPVRRHPLVTWRST